MIVLGVDIGLTGAVAVLDSESGALVAVWDMPALKAGAAGRREINAVLLFDLITHCGATQAFVELVSARPGEGVSSSFSFGRSRGVVEACLASRGIPCQMITPASWRRIIGIPPKASKDFSRSEAIKRWPAKADLFKRKLDNGRSDAALIAIAGLMRSKHGEKP
jgi:crossover junction endodeoxyribonuclease RuvC